MIYVKSFPAGLLTLILAALIVVVGVAFAPVDIVAGRLSLQGGTGSFIVNGGWIPLWLIALVVALIFSAGFYWQFRRARCHR